MKKTTKSKLTKGFITSKTTGEKKTKVSKSNPAGQSPKPRGMVPHTHQKRVGRLNIRTKRK